MKERLVNGLAWVGFLSLIFGMIPLLTMAVGYQLEERQNRPEFGLWRCDQLAADPGYQEALNAYQEDPARFNKVGIRIEEFDPEKCRIAGSGQVTAWVQEGRGMGFIYAKLSEREMLHRLGYRTFFQDLSESRWFYTAVMAAPCLPLLLLIYLLTGSIRIFPWASQTQREDGISADHE